MDVTKTCLITLEPAHERARGHIQNFSRLPALAYHASHFIDVLLVKDNIIDKSIYGYDKHLEISNVTGLMGKYQCRVVNEHGSEFSDIADLKVFSK